MFKELIFFTEKLFFTMPEDEPEAIGIEQMQNELNEKWKQYRAENERQLEMYRAQMSAQKELNRFAIFLF